MRVYFYLACLCAAFFTSSAWLLPERCQPKKIRRTRSEGVKTKLVAAPPTSDIADLAAEQERRVNETYKDFIFTSVPIRGHRTFKDNMVELDAPFNCRFKTMTPGILSTIACHDTGCMLEHTISTIETYTASESFKFGVKFSFGYTVRMFEVGAEFSFDGTFECTFTKGRTTRETIECWMYDFEDKSGNLQLYVIKSDMVCDVGKITMEKDVRDNKQEDWVKFPEEFTFAEAEEMLNSTTVKLKCDGPAYDSVAQFKEHLACLHMTPCMIDVNKISNRLLNKILKKFPLYNPYTDVINVPHYSPLDLLKNHTEQYRKVKVDYYKETKSVKDYAITVPFSNEEGNAEFQYACLITPFS